VKYWTLGHGLSAATGKKIATRGQAGTIVPTAVFGPKARELSETARFTGSLTFLGKVAAIGTPSTEMLPTAVGSLRMAVLSIACAVTEKECIQLFRTKLLSHLGGGVHLC